MTKEYALTRTQWFNTLLRLVSAPDSERDELFCEAELLFAHMKRQEPRKE